MSSVILKSFLCFFLQAAWYTDQFYKKDWLTGGLDSGQTELAFSVCSFRCWWKTDLKLPFSPVPSNKPGCLPRKGISSYSLPAEAWLLHRVWVRCCFWFSRSPAQGRYTSQDGQHHMDASIYPTSPQVFGSCNRESQLSRASATLWTLHPLLVLVHTQLQHWPPQGVRQQELQQGKDGIPNKRENTQKPKSAEHKTLPLQGNKTCWHCYWSLFCKALSNKFKHFEPMLK